MTYMQIKYLWLGVHSVLECMHETLGPLPSIALQPSTNLNDMSVHGFCLFAWCLASQMTL